MSTKRVLPPGCGVALVVILIAARLPAQIVEVAQFQVVANPVVGQYIEGASVAAGLDDSMVFIWGEWGYDAARQSAIFTRRFSTDGLPLGPPVRVDSGGIVEGPVISADWHGGYVATWDRLVPSCSWCRSLTPGPPIGRRLDATGTAVGDELILSAGGGQPRVAGLPSGSVFVWNGFSAQSPAFGLFGPDGKTRRAAAAVTDPDSNAYYLQVKAVADGGFIVTWFVGPSLTPSWGRRFRPDGTPRGSAFLLSDHMAVSDIAVNPLGGFAVVGTLVTPDQVAGGYWSGTNTLLLRYFADDGSPLGDPVLVYEDTSPVEIYGAALDFDGAGHLYVHWEGILSDQAPRVVSPPQGRVFDATGVPLGGALSIWDHVGGVGGTALLANGNLVNVLQESGNFQSVYASIVRLCEPGAADCPTPLATGTPLPTYTRTSTSTATLTRTATVSRTPTRSPTPTPSCGSACRRVQVQPASGPQGESTAVAVSLRDLTADVVGVQNDLAFVALAPIAVLANGQPDCTVNSAIEREATSFAFLPPGCTPGLDCGQIRAIVFSLENLDPIADGAELYTCHIDIAGDAPPGRYPLLVSSVILSDAGGRRLDASGGDSIVTVTGRAPRATTTATEAPTFTPAAMPRRTPTPLCGLECRQLQVGPATGRPGERVSVPVHLRNVTGDVAATQNDLVFAPLSSIAVKASGQPDCVVNPTIDKEGGAFAFLPTGCMPGVDCKRIRAVVISFGNTDTIDDGALLYTCHVDIRDTAPPGAYPLAISNIVAASPAGAHLNVTGSDGILTVTGAAAQAAQAGQAGQAAPAARSPGGGCAIDGFSAANGWWLMGPPLWWLRRWRDVGHHRSAVATMRPTPACS